MGHDEFRVNAGFNRSAQGKDLQVNTYFNHCISSICHLQNTPSVLPISDGKLLPLEFFLFHLRSGINTKKHVPFQLPRMMGNSICIVYRAKQNLKREFFSVTPKVFPMTEQFEPPCTS